MIGLAGRLLQPLLRKLEPEVAHSASIAALKLMPPLPLPASRRALETLAFGLTFPNPLGLAAGFDKGAEVADPLLRLGFGFVEVGTITPLPQPGNPRPRLFRLPADEGVINRFGFNSEGHAPPHARLLARRSRPGVIGVNIGANKEAADRSADYVAGIVAFADVAGYFAVNVSSPNTPGLRDLQQAAALDELLARVLDARDAAIAAHGRKPVLLKISPDLTAAGLDDVVRVARARRIDGMIVSNTTLARPASLRDATTGQQAGGLSGKPLFALSTRVLAQTFLRVEQQFPLIGAGGVDSATSAWAKIEAGASLVQLYSSLVYKGPGLVREILEGLALRCHGSDSLAQATGRLATQWAAIDAPQ